MGFLDLLKNGGKGLLDKMVDNVNNAAKQVDLSGVKGPTIKTNNSFQFQPVMVIGILAIVAFFLFKKR
jgi:hypothetical protein